MKEVNFIEAVEYAIKKKEVHCEILGRKHYLVYEEREQNICIISETSYENLDKIKANNTSLYPHHNFNSAVFYLNKWTIKDE